MSKNGNETRTDILDLQFINPFILGAVQALQVQGGLKMEGGKPFLKGKQPQPRFIVAGVLGLTSNKFRGALTLWFEEAPFLKMLEFMLGEKIEAATSEYADAAAEVLNITYGAAKTKLNETGYQLERALPTVLFGNDFTARHSSLAPIIVIPLICEFGQVHIEISVDISVDPS